MMSPETFEVRIAPSLLLLTLAATAALGAEVYRSTDANGNVVYSDVPLGNHPQQVTILTPHPGQPAPMPQPKPLTTAADKAGGSKSAASDAAKGAGGAAKKEPPQTPAEHAAEKAKLCETARQRQQTYAVSHRLYRAGANGEREYLNDKEIDEAKARAAADVATWCN